jgi:hypothetical protein
MMKKRIGLILLMALHTGCASMMMSRNQTIYVDSDPKGVTVHSNTLHREVTTPTSFSFQKGGEIYLGFSKEGYLDQSVQLRREVAPSFWLNLLWFEFAPIAMLVDHGTGAMWNYEGAVYARLEKTVETDLTASSTEAGPVTPRPFKSEFPKASVRDGGSFGGVRVGVSYLSRSLMESLRVDSSNDGYDDSIDIEHPFVTQFGFQFEKKILVGEGKSQILLQLIPLVGGVDQGEALLSLSGIIGIRTPNGLELGMGPTFLDAWDNTITSVVYTMGTSREYGGLKVPLTLMAIPSRDGFQANLLTGFSW